MPVAAWFSVVIFYWIADKYWQQELYMFFVYLFRVEYDTAIRYIVTTLGSRKENLKKITSITFES